MISSTGPDYFEIGINKPSYFRDIDGNHAELGTSILYEIPPQVP